MSGTSPDQLSGSDSIQIRIDEFMDTRSSQSNLSFESNDSPSSWSSSSRPTNRQHKQLTISGTKMPFEGGQEGIGLLGVRERRERRNSWCSTRPSEALANLKRKWFAAISSNANGKVIAGDDADDPPGIDVSIGHGKCKSFSLTSLDGEEVFASEDEKLPANQVSVIHHLDRPTFDTLSPSPVPGFHGDDRFLGNDLFSGRNARSEQDVRGGEDKADDKLDEIPDPSELRTERFSLESDNLFAVKTGGSSKSRQSLLSGDEGSQVQASNQGDRCVSPTPLRGCPDKNNRSDHPNLDLLVARHKSEGSLQKYPGKELKLASSSQGRSSVFSKINSYRNTRKNKAPPVETHNFVSISSSSLSSSSSSTAILAALSTCEVCGKALSGKKNFLKCLDCGVLVHNDSGCKDQALSYPCFQSTDEQKSNSNAKSDDASDMSSKFNKGNSSATTTESDSLDLPDASLEEADVMFSSCITAPTGTPVTLQGPSQVEDEEAWSLTVDDAVLSSMSSSEIKRQNLIWELIKNEKHHHRILKMVLDVFVGGLKNEVGLDARIVNQLFPRLDGLIYLHGNILKALLQQQNIRPDRRIDDLSSVLLEQFGGTDGRQMEILYGDFCSQHERAINLYKELKRCDRKFQNFINKCVSVVACERRGIDSCILTVTQRLTKYPLLVEQILKYTDDDTECRGLREYLLLVRSIIKAVNDRVDSVAKKERFEEIFDKLDHRSTTTIGNKTIKRADILNMEKCLRFHGWIKLKTARGRTVDTLVVVLMDWIVFLTENNHKYFFSNIDSKSSIMPLSKLLVREKDDKHEGRNFFLISSNWDAPAEMYELVCKSNSELKYWTSILRQATNLSASKAVPDGRSDFLGMLRCDQSQLISLIESLQSRDEELKATLGQKLSTIEEFYKNIEKLSPGGNLNESTNRQMSTTRSIHLSLEELVRCIHVQETSLIASLQCSNPPPANQSQPQSKENESTKQDTSRRPSSASLFAKVSHSSSFRNINDTSADLPLHHSTTDVVSDVDGDVESIKVKRKVSDAAVMDSKYFSKTSVGILPGFLSIFCKDKEDSLETEETHKHRKQSSLNSQQLSFQPQQQNQQQQQLHSPIQAMLQQQLSQPLNRVASQDQQTTNNSNNSINFEQTKLNSSLEADDILCNFLNTVHSLSITALDLSTEAKKKEVQIICMTKQLEKLEKQSFPLDQHMEELRGVQNNIQSEKFQLQELRQRHQEDLEKFQADIRLQATSLDQQKAEIKAQKEELQRQRDALQRQIDLFEEQKSNHNSRSNQSIFSQSLESDVEDPPRAVLHATRHHERNQSNPHVFMGKPISAAFGNPIHQNRSDSPAISSSLSTSSSISTTPPGSSGNKHPKQTRAGSTLDQYEPSLDEKNGVLVSKKDSVPLLPVHLVSARNESRLDRHSVVTSDDNSHPGHVRQLLPKKLATTHSSTKQTTQKDQHGGKSNSIKKKDDEDSKPKPILPGSKPGINVCNNLPLHLAEKSRVVSSSSSLQHHPHALNSIGNKNLQQIATFNFVALNNLTTPKPGPPATPHGSTTTTAPSSSSSSSSSLSGKPSKTLFGSSKKLSQLLLPSSPSSASSSSSSSSTLQAMMTSSLLSPKVQFLSFPNYSNAVNHQASTSSSSSWSTTSAAAVSVASVAATSSSSSLSSSSLPVSATVVTKFKDADDEIIFL